MAKFFTSSWLGDYQYSFILPNVVGFAEYNNTNPPEEISSAILEVWTKDFSWTNLRVDPPDADAQRFKDEWTTYLNNQSVFNKRRVYFPAPQYITDSIGLTGWTFLAKDVSTYYIGTDSGGEFCVVSSTMWPFSVYLYDFAEIKDNIRTYDATAIQNLKNALNEIYT